MEKTAQDKGKMAKRIYEKTINAWGISKGITVGTFAGLLLFYLATLGSIEITEPYEDIKWSFGDLDSTLYGKVLEEWEYTPTTDKLCKDNKCTMRFYGGIRNIYEDKQWKRVENARSLKGIFPIIYLEKDNFHQIEVIDFNYTSIMFELDYDLKSPNISEYEKEIEDGKLKSKLKVVEFNETSGDKIEREQEVEVEKGLENTIIINEMPLGKEFHFGESSTTVIIGDADQSEIIEDVTVGAYSVHRGTAYSDADISNNLNQLISDYYDAESGRRNISGFLWVDYVPNFNGQFAYNITDIILSSNVISNCNEATTITSVGYSGTSTTVSSKLHTGGTAACLADTQITINDYSFDTDTQGSYRWFGVEFDAPVEVRFDNDSETEDYSYYNGTDWNLYANEVLDVDFYYDSGPSRYLLKFNTSQLPDDLVIENVTLFLYKDSGYVESGETMIVDQINNSWDDSTVTYSTIPAVIVNNIDTLVVGSADDVYYLFDVVDTNFTYGEVGTNTADAISYVINITGGAIEIDTREDSWERPYLEVVYSDTNYLDWEQNQTNSTVAGENVLFSVFWNSSVNLSSYIFGWYNGANWTKTNYSGDEEAGEQTFSGEIGGAEGEGDPTIKQCGTDCSGGDYTYPSTASCTDHILADSCAGASSCDGTDTVVDIWLNGTNFTSTDSINVTTQVMCYGTGDEVKIWYYNGITWTEEFYDATCNYPAAIGNYSDIIQITSESATQYIRVQVTYGTLSGDDQCYTGTYGDNDDISFNVVTGGGSDDVDANKTAVEYLNVFTGDVYEQIDNLTITSYVSYYNSSGSIASGNANVTLWLEVYNGTDWLDEGDFSVTGTGNFTKTITTSSILAGWQTDANRDIKISARLLDYNDSSHFDTINWTGVWIDIFSEEDFLMNDSVVAFTDAMCSDPKEQCWSNVTKQVTSTVGATVKWQIWANNSDSDSNTTSIFQFVTTTSGEDTCTCAGVDTNWEVDMEDMCTLSTPCNLGTGNLSWIGSSGYFICDAQLNLTNRNVPPSNTIFYFYDGCEINR